MRRFNSITLFVLGCSMFAGVCFAQNNNSVNNLSISIPEVALLSIQSSAPGAICLSPQAPQEAGLALDFAAAQSGSFWLNYSSVSKSISSMYRHLDVAMEGTLPEGVQLKLAASPDAGLGKGKVGIPSGEITLTEIQQQIITSIGSCYTGSGADKGHRLTYFLKSDDDGLYSKIAAGTLTVQVTFTLSDGG